LDLLSCRPKNETTLSSGKKRQAMIKKPGKGQIINHSEIPLLVLETDSGQVIAHILGAKRKSPESVDADGFRRADGQSIFLHKSWWKIVNFTTADIWQLGKDMLVPTSLAIPVGDQHFGKIKVGETPGWGESLTYVSSILRNKRGRVTGYVADRYGRLSKKEAIRLAKAGKLDNVVVVTNSQGTTFLRTKKNAEIMDNLTA
jgi:hypothetical protein